MKMKCLSLWQPWASLVAIGAKRIETRSWSTQYRGPLAIHAAQHYSMETAEFANETPCRAALAAAGWCWATLPFGALVATTSLYSIVPCEQFDQDDVSDEELIFGDFRPGRFAWILDNVVPLVTPIPCRGRQQLFDVEIP